MISKAPALPLYVKDLQADETWKLMSAEERGVYISTLIHQWNEGSIPADLVLLAEVLDLKLSEVRRAWPTISKKFRPLRRHPDRLINRKLDGIRLAQKRQRLKQVESGRRGAEVVWEKRRQAKQLDGNPIGDAKGSPCLAFAFANNRDNSSSLRSEELSLSFDHFWSAYPRKVGKQKCLRWWKSHKPDATLLQKMLAALEQQTRSRQWQDPQYIPHPYTWLNQGRWEDEPIGMPTPIGPEYTPDPERLAHLKEIERQAREGRQQ